MYVYIQTEPNLWTVGFYDPTKRWVPESDHATPEKAADRVHYLNGGSQDDPEESAWIVAGEKDGSWIEVKTDKESFTNRIVNILELEGYGRIAVEER